MFIPFKHRLIKKRETPKCPNNIEKPPSPENLSDVDATAVPFMMFRSEANNAIIKTKYNPIKRTFLFIAMRTFEKNTNGMISNPIKNTKTVIVF